MNIFHKKISSLILLILPCWAPNATNIHSLGDLRKDEENSAKKQLGIYLDIDRNKERTSFLKKIHEEGNYFQIKKDREKSLQEAKKIRYDSKISEEDKKQIIQRDKEIGLKLQKIENESQRKTNEKYKHSGLEGFFYDNERNYQEIVNNYQNSFEKRLLNSKKGLEKRRKEEEKLIKEEKKRNKEERKKRRENRKRKEQNLMNQQIEIRQNENIQTQTNPIEKYFSIAITATIALGSICGLGKYFSS